LTHTLRCQRHLKGGGVRSPQSTRRLRWSIARAMPSWWKMHEYTNRFYIKYTTAVMCIICDQPNPSIARGQAAAEIFYQNHDWILYTGLGATCNRTCIYQEMNSLPNHVCGLDEDLLLGWCWIFVVWQADSSVSFRHIRQI
jgi:hypothetical protein